MCIYIYICSDWISATSACASISSFYPRTRCKPKAVSIKKLKQNEEKMNECSHANTVWTSKHDESLESLNAVLI